ncbi:MAG: SpoIIE family protein phosphatase [Oscillospiraceae bacterium]|nr:SpoIIE family protein phosphatase [Oscillospiraceae bacterium]
MTAVSQKIQKFKKNKENPFKSINTWHLTIYLFLAVSRTGAVWCDVPFSFLAFVLTAACPDLIYKYIMAAVSAITFALMAVSDIFYLPYMLWFVAYITGWKVTDKEKWRTASGTIVFAVAKIVLICLKSPFRYTIYTFMECCLVYRLSGILSSVSDLSANTDTYTFADAATAIFSGLILIISLTGADNMWLYTSIACGLAVIWLYSGKNQLFFNISGLLCLFFALVDKSEFSLLFIIFSAIWVSGTVYSEKHSVLIYPAVSLTAVIMNLAFLPQLKGFVVTTTALTGLLIYTVLPMAITMNTRKKTDSLSRQKDYRQLMTGIKKLESSLNYLGSCAIDISNLNEKTLAVPPLEDIVAEEICRKCDFFPVCWQQKYSFTVQQFSKYAGSMYSSKEKGFDMGFYSQCAKPDVVKKSFEENFRLILSRKYAVQSSKNNQKMLQSAFMSVSAAIGDLIHHSRTSRLINNTITMQMDNLLDEMDILHSYCLCSQNPDKSTFAVSAPLSDNQLYRIKLRLEQLYGEKFADSQCENQNGELVYTFYSQPFFACTHRVESQAYKSVNGDSWEMLQIEGKLYIILSDGMGTGPSAAAESRTVLEMTCSLLNAQCGVMNTINLVNLAMNLRGNGEGGASLDILCIDMYTGQATLIKAGAGATALLTDGMLVRYYKDSLPLGVVKDIKISTEEFQLKQGDTVIMMSDGTGNISANVRNLYDSSCRDIARYVINENKTMDDKTVIVLKLKISSAL